MGNLTKGKWGLSQCDYSSKLFGTHTGFNVTANNGQRTICNITLNNSVGVPERIRKANAELITASPDLLEACNIMKDWIEWKYSDEANKDINMDNVKKLLDKLNSL